MQGQVKIISGFAELSASTLAEHVRTHGFVVFDCNRSHQRALGKAIVDLLGREDGVITFAETPGGVGAMCVIDLERYSLFEVLDAASEAVRRDPMNEL